MKYLGLLCLLLSTSVSFANPTSCVSLEGKWEGTCNYSWQDSRIADMDLKQTACDSLQYAGHHAEAIGSILQESSTTNEKVQLFLYTYNFNATGDILYTTDTLVSKHTSSLRAFTSAATGTMKIEDEKLVRDVAINQTLTSVEGVTTTRLRSISCVYDRVEK